MEKVVISVQPIHSINACELPAVDFCCTAPCPNSPQISSLFCSDIGLDFVLFEWEDVMGITGYEINLSINGGTTSVDTIQNSELRVSDLNPEDEVSISVVAINLNQACGNSLPHTISCIATACSIPLFATSEMVFCWTPSDGPLQLTIGEVFDSDGNILNGDVIWLSEEVDSLTGLLTPPDSVNMLYKIPYKWTDEANSCQTMNTILVQVNFGDLELLISCEDANNNSVTFIWPECQGALGYNYSINGDTTNLTTNTEVTIDGLSDNDTIHIEIDVLFNSTTFCNKVGSRVCIKESTISTSQLEKLQLAIYPNPVEDELYFNLKGRTIDISLSNLNGEIIYNYKEFEENKLDLSQLPSGLYLLILTEGQTGKIKTERLIVI